MEDLLLDIKYALGRFVQEPVVTAIIVITLALGIGVSTSIFSVVNGLVLQALPFDNSEQLVAMRQSQSAAENDNMNFSAQEVLDYRAQSSQLEELTEYHSMTFTMYGKDDPLLVRTGVVSPNFFDLLSLEPHLGRFFAAEEGENGAEPLVLLTYEFWQNAFDGRADVLNETIEMNNKIHKIIGVLPHFSQFPNVNDIYMTVPSCPFRSGEKAINNRDLRFLTVYGKIKTDSNVEQLNTQLTDVAQRSFDNYPAAYKQDKNLGLLALPLEDELVKDTKPLLFILLGTTVMLLLIASANVTNLTLSQHAKRRRELAVRSSLGASRMKIARQLLTESLLLGLVSGLLGLFVAYFGTEILMQFTTRFTGNASEIALDVNVMLFTLFISVLAGVVSGLTPALTKINLVSSLKEGGKATFTTRNQPVRNLLLIAQFTFSLTLIIIAGLTIKSLQELGKVNLGYNPDDVQIVQVDLNWSIYKTPLQQWQFAKELLQNVSQLPYSESSAISMTYPMDNEAITNGEIRESIQLDDRDFDANNIIAGLHARPVSHGYIETIGAQLLQGRLFSDRDDENAAQVTVINSSLAKKLWPNEQAVDHKMSLDKGETWLRIIGVVADIKEIDNSATTGNQIYVPLAQSPTSHIAIMMKTTEPADTYVRDVQEIILQINNKQALAKTESLREALDNTSAIQRFIAKLLTIFAALAVAITISGVGGVMAYLVAARTREIGVRMAIGANKKSIIIMVVAYGAKLTVVGLVVGLGVTVTIAQAMAPMFFNVEYFDLPIYLFATLGLFSIAILACVFPAIKASSASPVAALRTT
jgi:putative ABC transport system permease protein